MNTQFSLPIFALILLACFFGGCMEQIPSSCKEITPDHVISWTQKAMKDNKVQVYWITKAQYEGNTIFLTQTSLHGIGFCGTGLELDDMYIVFDCNGKEIEGLSFLDVNDYQEFYDGYSDKEPEPENTEPS